VLTSVVIDAALAQASYTVTVPENTDITVEYREGEGDNWGRMGAFESGQVIGSKEKIQYRVLFTSRKRKQFISHLKRWESSCLF